MDLRSLMNDAAPARPPQERQERSDSQRDSFPTPQRSASGAYNATPSHPQLHHQQQQQQQQAAYYPVKPPQVHPYQQHHDGRSSNASMPSTPMAGLHTPHQHYAGQQQQYPFPSQQQQQQQQHRSPSQHYPQMTPRQHSQPRQPSQTQSQPPYPQSLSTTPPVTRHSPHGYPPPQSHPSTPLGPPMQPFLRQSSSAQVPHQRSASAASYGLGPQHHPSIASQSPALSAHAPSAYPHESPQVYDKRPSLDYSVSASDRDRSVSVSPKTKVVLPTRQNSQDASWGTREGYPTDHRSSDHAISPLTTTKQPTRISPASLPRLSSQTTPGPGLRGILNDDPIHRSPMMVSSPAATRGPSIPPPPQYSHSQSQSSIPTGSPTQTFDSRPSIKREPSAPFTSESLLRQPVGSSHAMSPVKAEPARFQSPLQHAAPTLKRAAESDPERAMPIKKTKKRYAQPPVWARYMPSNPRYDPEVDRLLGPPPAPQAKRASPRPALQAAAPPQRAQRSPSAQRQQQPPPHAPSRPNGHGPSPVSNGHAPHMPVVNQILGPWEPNVISAEPTDPLIQAVGNFLLHTMLRRPEIENGAIEIEAKLGVLIDRRSDQRLNIGAVTPTVLNSNLSQGVRFESFMSLPQHKTMNDFLNKSLVESQKAGRVPMVYRHTVDRDTFAGFTPSGVEALPPIVKDEVRVRKLRLRTTERCDVKTKARTGEYTARIVKIRLGDLDMCMPLSQFDCRISINIELDLNRADMDTTLLVEGGNIESGGVRIKDRMSYKHLAYSLDLTQVTPESGDEKTHELEIEVDAVRLREQAERAQAGAENGFEEMVKGLVSNIFTLMRVPVPPRG